MEQELSVISVNSTSRIIELKSLEIQEKGIMSDELRDFIEQIIVFVMLPVNVMGIITNLINIRVFVEQGVINDTTNIGFFSISVSDLLGCIALIPYNLCYIVKYVDGVPKQLTCVAFATQFVYVHVILQRASAWITIYLSLVRSLCVVIPLKVKFIFTPKVSVFVVVFIILFFFVILLPYVLNTKIVWAFSPVFNESFAYVTVVAAGRKYLYYKTIVDNQGITIIATVTVTITTSVMVHKLIQVRKWRQKNARCSDDVSKKEPASSDSMPLMAKKDVELVKAVLTITGIFLICLLLTYIPAVAMLMVPGVNLSGINKNLFSVSFLSRFLFNAINASINFFFYIRNSSRYKAAFISSFQSKH